MISNLDDVDLLNTKCGCVFESLAQPGKPESGELSPSRSGLKTRKILMRDLNVRDMDVLKLLHGVVLELSLAVTNDTLHWFSFRYCSGVHDC